MAIVFIDVVDYSRHMELDEGRTHAQWMSMRRLTVEPRAAACRGRIVKSTGDGVLIEFSSSRAAVQCCLDIQGDLASGRAHPQSEPCLQLRAGVHVGDVIAEGDDIYGDGVNVAARLQDIAVAGEVVISAAVFEQLEGKEVGQIRDLGDRIVKNLRRPLRVYAIAPAGQVPAPRTLLTNVGIRPSIAVLPFHGGGAAGHELVVQGVAEDVVAGLARIPSLFVISRSSTLAYRGREVDVRTVGRDLGVRYVVGGTVRCVAGRVRISAELADSETGAVVWTDRFHGRLASIFDLQNQIATNIVEAIAPHIREAERRRLLLRRPDSLRAYNLVLQAMSAIYEMSDGKFTAARPLLQQAGMVDPAYAAADAWLARWHMIRVNQGWSTDPESDRSEARRLANAALDKDPGDPVALAVAGHCSAMFDRDYDKAAQLFERALSVDPNSSLAWMLSSGTFSYIEQGPEAVARAGHALRLSPQDPHLFYLHMFVSMAHLAGGNLDEAIRWGRSSRSINSRYTANLRILAVSLAARDHLEEGREVVAALLAREPGLTVSRLLPRWPFRNADTVARHMALLGRVGLPA